MKNVFILLTFILMTATSFAQNCIPEPDLPADFLGVYPLTELEVPCDTIIPMDPAEIGVEYNFTFTAFAPDTFDYNGTEVSLINVTVNDVTGLPAGLSFICEPADCVFPGGQAGCMKITGTTTAPAGIYPLEISATVNALFGIPLPIDVTFPPAPDNNLLDLPTCPYKIEVVETSSNQTLFAQQISVGQNNPNPFAGSTIIPVNAKFGDYTFAVYNTIGELMHSEEKHLVGRSDITFDASGYETGIYFYTLSNENGSVTKRMIVK